LLRTHTNLKQVIQILFKQEIHRDLLLACKHHSSFYIFDDIRICNNYPLVSE